MLVLHEPVILAKDLPDLGLKADMEGWVVDVLDGRGKDYEVEFSDANGNTVYLGPLAAEVLTPVKPRHE